MAEWLKAHAWKACILQKGIEGSNPSLSAKIFREKFWRDLTKSDVVYYIYILLNSLVLLTGSVAYC